MFGFYDVVSVMVARKTGEPRAAPAAAEKPREAQQAVNVAVLAASGVACMKAHHHHHGSTLHHSSNMLLGFTPCR